MGSVVAVLVLTDCVVLSLNVVVLGICLCCGSQEKSHLFGKAQKKNYFSDYFPIKLKTL